MFRRLLAFLAILIFSIFFLAAQQNSVVQNSTITIQNPKQLEKEYIVLEGPWDYIKQNFVQLKEFYPEPERKIPNSEIVTLPHCFEKDVNYATYHCRIEGLLPNKHYAINIYGRILSSCRIWCNMQLVGASGFIGKNKYSTKPAQNSNIIDLLSDSNGIVDIVIHVSDFELEKGGIIKNLVLTEKSNFEKKYLKCIFFSTMIIAYLFILIIYNLILLVINRKFILYFSLLTICSFFILSTATSGISIFNMLFPNVPFWIEFRLSIFLISVDIGLYIFYMGISRRISFRNCIVLYTISFALSVVIACVPIKIFAHYQTVFVLISFFIFVLLLLSSLRFLVKKNLKTKDFLSLDVMLYNFDMIVNIGIISAFFYDFIISPNKTALFYSCVAFKFGIFLFGIMQCAIPAFRRYFVNYRIQKSSERFEMNNNLLAKFVPEQVLEFMNVEDITKIIPGNCHILDAIVVYTEIRYFKQLAESIDNKELFDIVTVYYKEIAPIIRSHGGYVAKYMNHGCLAVFIERNDASIHCAIKMQEKMNDVRRILRKKHKADFSIGIAIHTGKIACGVIGSEKRLDSIIFSPEIQTTIKIGMQTSKTNAKILITEDAMSYCRTYTDCMYEGHFLLIGGKRILVYNAMLFKEFNKFYDGNLELVEEIEAIATKEEVDNFDEPEEI